MTVSGVKFESRRSIEQVEEGTELAPKFDERGLIAVVTTDAESGDVLMQGYNERRSAGAHHQHR